MLIWVYFMEVILDRLIHIYLKDEKTNICIPFSLKKKYSSLEFICSYEPKKCEDKEKARQMIMDELEKYSPQVDHESKGSWEIYLSKVVSLITVSVDYKGQYLGCSHRLDNEQRHIISADFSSPGFFRHSVDAGDWRVLINVHSVVSPDIRCCLQIIAHNRKSV